MKFVSASLLLSVCMSVLKVGAGDVCVSRHFTSSGECCSLCPAGTGVAFKCGQQDTKCQPCQNGLTFSDSEGLSVCRPCSRCPPGVPQLSACTATQDTQCDCGRGYFLWKEGNGSTNALCAPCQVCGRGEGVARPCGPAGNTACQPCSPGTFSEVKSSVQSCFPCSRCGENKVEIRPCQANSDTLCMEKDLNIISRPNGSEGSWDFPRRPVLMEEESEFSGSAAPKLGPRDPQSGNNILIYVSVLAAVVLGLLIYVAYKCWKSFQQKAALGKARAAELNNVVEGEKLHSDSGVFLDSHSLQDSQPSKGGKHDSRLYANLPPSRHDEVEKLLAEGGSRSWRQLAAVLGYEQDRADMFGHGEDPIRTLLTDWAQQEGSTLDRLSTALTAIERHDVTRALTAPTQGVTVV